MTQACPNHTRPMRHHSRQAPGRQGRTPRTRMGQVDNGESYWTRWAPVRDPSVLFQQPWPCRGLQRQAEAEGKRKQVPASAAAAVGVSHAGVEPASAAVSAPSRCPAAVPTSAARQLYNQQLEEYPPGTKWTVAVECPMPSHLMQEIL